MSYPPPPDYRGSHIQQPGDSHGYIVDRNAPAHRYNNRLPTPTASPSLNYGMQKYDWPHTAGTSYTNSYPHNGAPDGYRQDTVTSSQAYAQSTGYSVQPAARVPTARQDKYPDRAETRTEGLHDLAYVSALQSSSQPRTHPTKSRHSPAPRTTSVVQNHTKSPSERNGSQSAHHNDSSSYSRQNAPSSTRSPPSQQLAMNAAAALAGAVSHRFPASTSPAIANASLTQIKATSSYSTLPRPQPPAVAQDPAYSDVRAQYPSVNSERYSSDVAGIPRNSSRNTNHEGLVANGHDSQVRSYTPTNEPADAAPAFVDPTRIFNPYQREHELRRQQAEAEAKRKSEEAAAAAAAAKAAEEAEKAAQAKAVKAKSVKQISTTQGGDSKTTPKGKKSKKPSKPAPDEMQDIMEKMQALKNRDPVAFQKLCDDLQEPASSSGTGDTTSSPQIGKHSAASTPHQAGAQTAQPKHTQDSITPVSGPNKKRPVVPPLGPDGTPIAAPLNGYKVTVENNPEGLPDLGRFPAERRVRASYAEKEKKKEYADDTPVQSPAITNHPSTSLPTATTPTAATTEGPAKAQGTVWPAEKRIALVKTAIRVLKAIPDNAQIPLVGQDIQNMLDRNPSYIQLCEELEARGLRFHRSQFARELLSSVPELSNSGQAQKASGITTAAVNPAAVSAPNAQSLPAPPQPPQPHGHHVPAPSRSGDGEIQVAFVPTMQKPPKINSEHTRTAGGRFGKQPPVGVKEAAARKRDFSEIIDMTGSDDEPTGEASKWPRTDEGGMVGPNGSVDYRQTPADTQPKWTDRPYTQPSQLNFVPAPGPIRFDQQAGLPLASQIHQPVGSFRPVMALAKPMKKAVAMQKKLYDPKTVARDVLITSGRHPTERPLNDHLGGLMNMYIETDSDVSTFRWDELDPGGPYIPPVEVTDVPAMEPTTKVGVRLRFPTKHRGPQHAKPSKPEAEKRERPRADPTAPAKSIEHQHQPAVTPNRPPTPSTPGPRSISVNVPGPSSARRDQPPSKESPKPAATPVGKQMSGAYYPSGKRRGRPPGARNKHPSQRRNPAAAETPAPPSAPQIIVPVRETPPKKDHYKCKWRLCNATLHNLNTLRKHVGKVHFVKDDQDTGYACWWRKCSLLVQEDDGQWGASEVFLDHDSWMRHIEEEHLQPIGQKWGDGPSTKHIDPIQVIADRQSYTSDIQGRSVTPLISVRAVEEQDYPRDTLSLTAVHQRAPGQEALTEKQKADNAAARWFLRAHFPGQSGRQQRLISEEVMRAMEVRKQKLGPGMDRGGCTLINEARRKTLVQNPGIQRVVDAGY